MIAIIVITTIIIVSIIIAIVIIIAEHVLHARVRTGRGAEQFSKVL